MPSFAAAFVLGLWLQTLSVFRWGLAEVLLAVAAKVRQGVEVHHVGDLGKRELFVGEEFLNDWDGGVGDVGGDAGAGDAADGIGEVFGRHMKYVGIVRNLALSSADARGKHLHQAADDVACAFGMARAAVMERMELEDVVDHRQAKAAHQSVIELEASVVQTLADAVDVAQKSVGVLLRKRDDGVIVEADAATDAVVVGRQKTVQKLVSSGKPFNLDGF